MTSVPLVSLKKRKWKYERNKAVNQATKAKSVQQQGTNFQSHVTHREQPKIHVNSPLRRRIYARLPYNGSRRPHRA